MSIAYKFIIVEDDRLLGKTLRKILERMGYQVLGIATTGEDAVDMCSMSKPHMVLMDIGLAGKMDGIDTAQIISGRFNIPVIYVTANVDDMTIERARGTDPFGYIVKPFDEKQLRPVITMALNKYQKERKLKEEYEEYKKIAEKPPELIFGFHPDGTITMVNEAYCRVMDKKPEEVIGKPLTEVLGEKPREEIKTPVSEKNKKYGGGEGDKYKPLYSIKTASRDSGVEINLIRLYERQGLLKPYRDPDNNYRFFTLDEIEWVGRIKRLIHEEGLHIEGIRRILTLVPPCVRWNCTEEEKGKCPAMQDSSYPCWHFKDEMLCCKERFCYDCENYIIPRQHPKLQLRDDRG